jgi:hypothetical protein
MPAAREVTAQPTAGSCSKTTSTSTATPTPRSSSATQGGAGNASSAGAVLPPISAPTPAPARHPPPAPDLQWHADRVLAIEANATVLATILGNAHENAPGKDPKTATTQGSALHTPRRCATQEADREALQGSDPAQESPTSAVAETPIGGTHVSTPIPLTWSRPSTPLRLATFSTHALPYNIISTRIAHCFL